MILAVCFPFFLLNPLQWLILFQTSYFSLKTLRRIFPEGPLGIISIILTTSGNLLAERYFSQCSLIDSIEIFELDFGTTYDTIFSPKKGSGIPTVATSSTPSNLKIISSISSGEILIPSLDD